MAKRNEHHVLPAGTTYYMTVDRKTLEHNQLKLRQRQRQGDYRDFEKPPCWIQVDKDKQNKINCWRVKINGPSEFVYGQPHICGAQVWVETTAELEYWV